MKRGWMVFVVLVIVILGLAFVFRGELQRVWLTTAGKAGTEVGTGMSTKEDQVEAVSEAVKMALKDKKNLHPDFAIIFATSGSDFSAIVRKAKELLGEKTKLYGGSSDSRAILTDKGFQTITSRRYEYALNEKKRGLSIMTISSNDIIFGTSATEFSGFPSVQKAAEDALTKAIADAGKSPTDIPQAILLSPVPQVEEEVIEGIESVVGKDVPLIGGTVGGWKFGVIGGNKVYEKGVSMAVIYTKLPLGWVFEGGFNVKDQHSGVVTKLDNDYTIAQIDNRPALDVYNEWQENKVYRLFKELGKADEISDIVALDPLYRKYTSDNGQDYYLFQYLWINEDTLKTKSVLTSTKIKLGDRLYLSHGTWETQLNRLANLPAKTKAKANIGVNQKPLLSLGYVCAGILGTIPEDERVKMNQLINIPNNNAPCIMNISWGEQGLFPGVGNKNGNLITSFLVIGN